MQTPQNGQTRSNNSSAVTDEYFECVWPFCGFGAERVKVLRHELINPFQANAPFSYHLNISKKQMFGDFLKKSIKMKQWREIGYGYSEGFSRI